MTNETHNPQHQQAPADDAPHAHKAPRKEGKPDQLNMDERKAESRQEALIDESLEESFPASDPPASKQIT
ncbi:hypothetical protein GCM10009116_10420 [Brevundimonas basaltis]|uniref:Uncharacterized protein n=1 Tax=Brevundimonas basaltis TaxID=472166 RepID=A0A7W8MHI4_9CAUL|nr:hypothetical protein [Brevundimonas basaltis]MBB5292036.1 hypothetical protein [Brevundimonas basaltis]